MKKSFYQYNAFSGTAEVPRLKHSINNGTNVPVWVDRKYITTGYRIGIAPNRITSTTIVECFPPREKIKNDNSMANLQNKAHNGKLSTKALSKMANAIDWLLASAKEKKVFSKKRGGFFNFKINFVTLTLPESKKEMPDIAFKDKLVKPFLNALRKYYGLNNYVWKIEFQKNGRLHLHLTTDTFLHHEVIKKQWNRVLRIEGLLDDFKAKFKHDEPNSTDIHSVVNIRDMAAYLMKYMSKQDAQLANVKGRIWGCSQKLSQAIKCRVIVEPNEAAEYYQAMNNDGIEAYDVEVKNEKNGKTFIVARIFKTCADWLKNHAHQKIRAIAHETLVMLRGHSPQVQPVYVV